MCDSSGHPTDPAERLAGLPPSPDKVRPVTVGDNVWLGTNCFILPGTTIGEGSIVAAGAVVRGEVPPYTVVAGNPARVVAMLRRPDGPEKTSEPGVDGGEAVAPVAGPSPAPG